MQSRDDDVDGVDADDDDDDNDNPSMSSPRLQSGCCKCGKSDQSEFSVSELRGGVSIQRGSRYLQFR